MTTSTATLTSFLLARIAEDEAVAGATLRETYPEGRGLNDGVWTHGKHEMDECEVRCESGTMIIYDEGGHGPNEAEHIARHDPARVMAECEAKRRVVEECRESEILSDEGTNGFVLACSVLRLLALPYASHAEYRSEWAP